MTRVWTVQPLPMPQVSNIFYPLNSSLEDEINRLFANFSLKTTLEPLPNVEDVMEEFRHNGRDFEYCPDVDQDTIRDTSSRKKGKKPLPTECVFCRNNGEAETYYRDHLLKDADGRILCPVLRAYTCPICGATGDEAHTIKYCSKRPKSPRPTMSSANAFKYLRNSMGRRKAKQTRAVTNQLANAGTVCLDDQQRCLLIHPLSRQRL